nr:MAG TPA: hypothetical protein [Caudoviricetes sp.]
MEKAITIFGIAKSVIGRAKEAEALKSQRLLHLI